MAGKETSFSSFGELLPQLLQEDADERLLSFFGSNRWISFETSLIRRVEAITEAVEDVRSTLQERMGALEGRLEHLESRVGSFTGGGLHGNNTSSSNGEGVALRGNHVPNYSERACGFIIKGEKKCARGVKKGEEFCFWHRDGPPQYRTCSHKRMDGEPCKRPVLKGGKSVCYWHDFALRRDRFVAGMKKK